MKRLPCLIRSVNVTFIKTKRGICLKLMVPVQFCLHGVFTFFKILQMVPNRAMYHKYAICSSFCYKNLERC